MTTAQDKLREYQQKQIELDKVEIEKKLAVATNTNITHPYSTTSSTSAYWSVGKGNTYANAPVRRCHQGWKRNWRKIDRENAKALVSNGVQVIALHKHAELKSDPVAYSVQGDDETRDVLMSLNSELLDWYMAKYTDDEYTFFTEVE